MANIGRNIKQVGGFAAFVPYPFPGVDLLTFSPEILAKAAIAERLLGKLDGISHTLPDANYFLHMYVLRDATSSSQIEGTRAGIIEALELGSGLNLQDTDADDILHYVKALNYGLQRLKEFPISLRFIREIHHVLMKDARSSQYSDPGEFRRSQNWIGGTKPGNAMFVPPPVVEMTQALDDLEKFIHNNTLMPVLQSGIIHAQFETIHPFLDGNGRAGRLLISLFLYDRALLEKPVLFLSSYFRKHQKLYYQKLNAWQSNDTESWLHFYLDAVIETAEQGIDVSKKIAALHSRLLQQIGILGKREATSGAAVLNMLFKMPLINNTMIVEQLGFTRPGAIKLIDRLIAMGILKPLTSYSNYNRTYIFDEYTKLFTD